MTKYVFRKPIEATRLRDDLTGDDYLAHLAATAAFLRLRLPSHYEVDWTAGGGGEVRFVSRNGFGHLDNRFLLPGEWAVFLEYNKVSVYNDLRFREKFVEA